MAMSSRLARPGYQNIYNAIPASNQLLADPWRPRESMGHSQSRFKSSMIALIAKIYSRTALGICKNSMVLGDSQKKRTYVQSPQDREWVSMVETVSALGRSTRPIAIF